MELLHWFAVITLVLVGEARPLTYIIPTLPSSQEASLCPENADHCLTLDDILRSRPSEKAFQSNEKAVFRSGMHILNSSSHQYNFLTVWNVKNLEIRGESDSTIVCLEDFNFHFHDVGYVKIANIHFQNCCKVDNKLGVPYAMRFMWDHSVKLHNVKITTNIKCTGILLDSVRNDVAVINSILSTKYIGIQSIGSVDQVLDWHPAKILSETHKLIIFNTTFFDSCLEIQNKYASCIIKNTTFDGCSCTALNIRDRKDKETILQDVRVKNSIGVMVVIGSHKFNIKGNCSFTNNSGAIILIGSILTFMDSRVEFKGNTIRTNIDFPGTVVYATGNRQTDSLIGVISSKLYFINNTGQHCGGITLSMGRLLLNRGATITFKSNYGDKGGALSFFGQSNMYVGNVDDSSNITVYFINNHAQKGGAIYIEDRDHLTAAGRRLTGFVVKLDYNNSFHKFKGTFKLSFLNNTAVIGGDNIYGGWIDWTEDRQGNVVYNPNAEHALEFIDDNDVSSNPTRVCMCMDHVVNCSIIEHSVDIFPGQTLTLEAVAVGQRFGSVVSVVVATFNPARSGQVQGSQNVQIVQRACTTLMYTIMSPNSEERLVIRPTESEAAPANLSGTNQYALLFQQFSILFKIKKCPLAFKLDHMEHKCICISSITEHNLNCDLNNHTILRNIHQWVGMTYIYTKPDENPGIISHQNCPFDYCRKDADSTSIHMEFHNRQCAFNRSGILCGQCQTNFSHILGSSRCKKCSDIMVFAIVPIVIVAGMLLIVFLMVLDLTVSTGTINGLIFYANIIRALHSTYFTPDISNSFMSRFIAWINLDLGVETCFYNGLDAYAKTWFQFVFPFYIWILVIIIIVSSHYSTIASRLNGRNAVQVLATLFLLSYTKLLRLVITVFSSTTITYPDGFVRSVWLYDGNVDFLEGKHLFLFIATLLLILCLSLPYTFTLVIYQWLLKISHLPMMFWLRKLKPLFDAYTGPYKVQHRYWTGLLLIVRIGVLVVVSLNRSNNPSTNLLMVAIMSSVLLLWLYFTRWVYESFLNNCLEVLFLCNLSVTSTALLFELSIDKQSSVMTLASTGVAFAIFICILIYHILKRLLQTRVGKNFKSRVVDFLRQKTNKEAEIQMEHVVFEGDGEVKKEVTSTVIELTKSLLQDSSH